MAGAVATWFTTRRRAVEVHLKHGDGELMLSAGSPRDARKVMGDIGNLLEPPPDLEPGDPRETGEMEGTYVLTASGASVTARAPEGMTYTAFTGALVTLLRDGVANGPELLTVGFLFPLLEQMLKAAGMPRPYQQTKDTAGLLALVRNAGFVPGGDAEGTTVGLPGLPIIGLPPPSPRSYRPAEERIRELKTAYPRFTPRAYDRLAAAYYDEGYRDDAERVLVEKVRMRYAVDVDQKTITGPLTADEPARPAFLTEPHAFLAQEEPGADPGRPLRQPRQDVDEFA